MSRSGRGPHWRAPRTGSRAGELVLSDGTVMLCLGRAASGTWMLLPMALFGTAAARGAVIKTDVPPTPMRAVLQKSHRPVRDRRGTWTRR